MIKFIGKNWTPWHLLHGPLLLLEGILTILSFGTLMFNPSLVMQNARRMGVYRMKRWEVLNR